MSIDCENGWVHLDATRTPEETAAFGARVASLLQSGDVVLLSGDLGAGKTCLVQGVASGLGCDAVPVSPTFNIVISYGGGRLPLHHFDLYRLDDAEQLDDIGLREYLEGEGACFVEWAEKFPAASDEYLALELRKAEGDGRVVFGRAAGERGEELLGLLLGEGEEAREPRGAAAALASAGSTTDLLIGRPAESAAAAPLGSRASSPSAATPGPSSLSEGVAVGEGPLVLAFDTANEVVAVGVGALDAASRGVRVIASRQVAAHRASNTTLLPVIDEMLCLLGIGRARLACIAVGRGPGSFTGVRIAVATAKGIAQALGLPLVGVSTLDAIAWNAWDRGVRGPLLVVADAMRKEVYPAPFALGDEGAERLGADSVIKAEVFAAGLGAADTAIAGDGLVKYRGLFEGKGRILSDKLWEVTGRGLLLALQAAWRRGQAHPLDAARHDPAFVLPVYTRLSDAEENERARSAAPGARDLVSGVQALRDTSPTGRESLDRLAPAQTGPGGGMSYRPLDAVRARDAASLEARLMGTDAWNERQFLGELGQRDRIWWAALDDGRLVGYAGALVADGELQVLKIAVDPSFQRRGIGRRLFGLLAEDGRNLGCDRCYLEVRASNGTARAFYRGLGLAEAGARSRYYSDGEDACLMAGCLPDPGGDVAGMALQHHRVSARSVGAPPQPLILAIESSCDETAAAVVDGAGRLLSDVVASQIDFHGRFGGVVPEIASRKHIEAICGVAAEALAAAGCPWDGLDAVAVTTEPGLLGALVVGVAFAKGAAWALEAPLVAVNHLEGHLYANRIGCPDFQPPAVASLVSGGNTLLVHMHDWGDYEVLGSTIDDAVGEAFDKVSKALGLGYPGGPVISRLAQQGDPAAIPFPRALLHSHDFRFSLSGLKTAVVNYIEGERRAGRPLNLPDIAASFQQAVIDVQVAKAEEALLQTGAPTFCLGGGVAANPALRRAYGELCTRLGVRLVMAPLESCGDNAAMIALAALDRYRRGRFAPLDADAAAHADLEQIG